MPDRKFPLRLNHTGHVRLGQTEADEQRVVSRLVSDGLRADGSRTGWLDRQRALTKLRFGMREPRNFPWPGCSNLSVPLIDSQIRRHKPLLMRLVVEADPVCEFVGEDPEAADSERIAEQEYNWLFRQHMNAVEPLAYTIDTMEHRGFSIVQVGWEYRTEYECRIISAGSVGIQPGVEPDPEAARAALVKEFNLDGNDPSVLDAIDTAVARLAQGAPFAKLAFKRVVVDRPALWDRDPVQVIVPPRTTDYANCEWIVVQHVFSVRQIEQMEADGYFKPGTAKQITAGFRGQGAQPGGNDESRASWSLEQQKSLDDWREQLWGTEDEDNVLLWEVFHWHDVDGDGLKDRVQSWIHPRSHLNCATRPYPYPFHRWPFVKFDFEKTSRRFHSPRGISAMLADLQREASAQHNARIDGMTIRNAPAFQTPVLAGFRAQNFRVIPGTVLHVPGGGQLTPLIQDRGAFPESVNEENLLRALAEAYVGNFDQAVQQPGQAGSRRTATEVNAAVQLAASTSSMDAILFQLAMKELHQLIWELWIDLRPDEVSYKVQGIDPNNPQEKLVKVTKADVAKRFKLVPTGTIANTNHALELANAKEALAYFANDQTGFINHYHLRRWYMTLLDYRRARTVINAPDQAREQVMLAQAAAALQQDPGLATELQGAAQAEELPVTNTEVQEIPTET